MYGSSRFKLLHPIALHIQAASKPHPHPIQHPRTITRSATLLRVTLLCICHSQGAHRLAQAPANLRSLPLIALAGQQLQVKAPHLRRPRLEALYIKADSAGFESEARAKQHSKLQGHIYAQQVEHRGAHAAGRLARALRHF